MVNNTPSGIKEHCESAKPESHQTAKMFFFFRWASSNLHDSFTMVFAQKKTDFPLSSAPAHHLFPGLKSHEAVWTAHWRTMASIATPFSHVHMHRN